MGSRKAENLAEETLNPDEYSRDVGLSDPGRPDTAWNRGQGIRRGSRCNKYVLQSRFFQNNTDRTSGREIPTPGIEV